MERVLLFCIGSDTEWRTAGISPAPPQQMMIRGLIERPAAGSYTLTDHLHRRNLPLRLRLLHKTVSIRHRQAVAQEDTAKLLSGGRQTVATAWLFRDADGCRLDVPHRERSCRWLGGMATGAPNHHPALGLEMTRLCASSQVNRQKLAKFLTARSSRPGRGPRELHRLERTTGCEQARFLNQPICLFSWELQREHGSGS
jgi:hypothetical protein